MSKNTNTDSKLHTFHFVYFTWNEEIKWVDIKAINKQQAINQWLLFKENANIHIFMGMVQYD